MGTESMMLSKRPRDDDFVEGFTKWPFMTTHTWAERPAGRWIMHLNAVSTLSLTLS